MCCRLIDCIVTGICQDQTPQEQTPPASAAENDTPAASADAQAATSSETPAPTPTETSSTNAPAADAATPDDAAEQAAKAAKLKDLLSLVQDNTLSVHKRENPAYFWLVKDVIDRTPEELRQAVSANRVSTICTKSRASIVDNW